MKLKSVVEKASGAQTERQRLSRQAEFKIVEKRLFWLTEEKTAANGRFGEIGGEVTVRISVYPLTVGDSPDCVQLSPNFAKPLGR